MGLKILITTLVFGAGMIFAIFQFGVNEMVAFLPSTDALVLNPHRAAAVAPKLAQTREAAGQPVNEIDSVLEASKAGEIKKLSAATTTISAPAILESPKVLKEHSSQNSTLNRQGVIEQTNLQRRTNLGAGYDLAENSLLDIAAQNKVDDMFRGQYFEHTSPAGVNAGGLIKVAGYRYVAVGENLAMGDFDGDADLVNAWMNSPGHRANILKVGYKEIGVAVGYGMFNGRMSWLAVQEFATPKTACPQVDDNLSAAIDSAKTNLETITKNQSVLSQKIGQERSAATVTKNELDDLIRSGSDNGAINQKQNEFNSAVTQLNNDIDSYNTNTKQIQLLYSSYKTQATLYNSQVTSYNSCVSAIK